MTGPTGAVLQTLFHMHIPVLFSSELRAGMSPRVREQCLEDEEEVEEKEKVEKEKKVEKEEL